LVCEKQILFYKGKKCPSLIEVIVSAATVLVEIVVAAVVAFQEIESHFFSLVVELKVKECAAKVLI
jgi:hypothetical protein